MVTSTLPETALPPVPGPQFPTDDRQAVPRRNRRRSVDELFAAAYFRYTRLVPAAK